jgi:hypothetical protein
MGCFGRGFHGAMMRPYPEIIVLETPIRFPESGPTPGTLPLAGLFQ